MIDPLSIQSLQWTTYMATHSSRSDACSCCCQYLNIWICASNVPQNPNPGVFPQMSKIRTCTCTGTPAYTQNVSRWLNTCPSSRPQNRLDINWNAWGLSEVLEGSYTWAVFRRKNNLKHCKVRTCKQNDYTHPPTPRAHLSFSETVTLNLRLPDSI